MGYVVEGFFSITNCVQLLSDTDSGSPSEACIAIAKATEVFLLHLGLLSYHSLATLREEGSTIASSIVSVSNFRQIPVLIFV